MTAVAPIPRRRRAAPPAPAPAEHSAAPPPDSSAHRLPFRPDVEGLRAVAILAVVAYHAGIPWMSGGFVGVDVFFVLSGFLITGLLLAEREATGTIGIAGFYARRMRRLLPAAAATTVATLAIAALVYPPHRVAAAAETAQAATLWSSNLLFASRATDYFVGGNATNPLLHTWSLSVEEQFYLAWPALVLLATRRRGRRGLAAALAAVLVASLTASLWWTTRRQPTAFYGTPMRAWEFATGGGVALLPGSALARLGGRLRFALGWFGVVAIAVATTAFTDRTPFPGVAALLPVVGTALVLACVAEGRASATGVLSTAPMQWVGRHSYGWYLWHWPLLVLGTAMLPGAGTPLRLGLVAASLAAAMATRIVVEEPCRRASFWRDRPRRLVGAGLASVAVLFTGAMVLRATASAASESPALRSFAAARRDVPRIYGDGCGAREAADSMVRVCRYGAKGKSAPVAVLFGDSHAAQWFPAIETLAAAKGWQLLVITKSGCPAADVPVYEPSLQRVSTECETWRRHALDSIRARNPLVIFAGSSNEYVLGNPYPEARESVPAERWSAGLLRSLGELSEGGATTVVLEDTPVAPVNVPSCLALAAWRHQALDRCDFVASRGRHEAAIRATRLAVRSVSGVRVVDLTPLLCPNGVCPAIRDGIVQYRDTRHVTARGVAHLAPAIASAVLPLSALPASASSHPVPRPARLAH